MRSFCLPLFVFLAAWTVTSNVQAGGTPLTTLRITAGLSQPVFAVSPPGDFERMFVVQQSGSIRIVNLVTRQLVNPIFLNISNQVSNNPNERGMLGLAFHPDYANNGFFYVSYTNNSGTSVIRRYTVSATNPNVADPSSAMNILTVGQPEWNHNGGMIEFGPNDGYLYIGFGDGGGGGDTFNTSQNPNTFLAKMLRIDVDGGTPYAIPPTNPFVGPGGNLDEIWATGVRNPWRWSFDQLTGDMYMADVGQGQWEEINFQPASSPGGENYGWRCMEGNHCFGSALPTCTCFSAALTDPIFEYSHGAGRCSITGGYVYRGQQIPDLDGTYFFAEWCTSQIWSLRYDGATVSDFEERTAELDPPGIQNIGSISSFAQDQMGEVYIIDRGGEIFKIVPANIATLDCNGNGIFDSTEFMLGLAEDCDNNGSLDSCEIAAGTADDCDGNGLLDVCEFNDGTAVDCDGNMIIDSCDIDNGADDCNNNGILDSCELLSGSAPDCNNNGVIDSCDTFNGFIDCDTNLIPDECELANGTAFDCNNNGILDTCDFDFGLLQDCDNNGFADSCDIADGNVPDCNSNGIPDSCDIASGFSLDANMNGLPDECEAAQFRRGDCNVDGGFDVADAIALLNFLFDPQVTMVDCLDACDSNDDGANNVADSVHMLAALFQMGNLPGAPFPDCGQDPTSDQMECDVYNTCP